MSKTYLIWGWWFSAHSTSIKSQTGYFLVVLLPTYTHKTNKIIQQKKKKKEKRRTIEDYGSAL